MGRGETHRALIGITCGGRAVAIFWRTGLAFLLLWLHGRVIGLEGTWKMREAEKESWKVASQLST